MINIGYHYFVLLRSFYKAWFDQDFQISMQNLRTLCSICDWKGTFEVYEVRLFSLVLIIFLILFLGAFETKSSPIIHLSSS